MWLYADSGKLKEKYMKILFKKLHREDWLSLHGIATSIYLDGQCYEFAMALHRGLGWPMVGLIENDVIRHALVASSERLFWDALGCVTKKKVGEPFNIRIPTLKPIDENKLRKVRPILDNDIEIASLFAEALWPNLPWQKNTFRRRTMDFLKELTSLCRRHKIWIRAPFPAAQIVLGNYYGNEKGFIASPTMDGQYFFDRLL